jgi:hypothetical protein
MLRIIFLILCVFFAVTHAFQQPALELDDEKVVVFPLEGAQITQHNNSIYSNLHRKLNTIYSLDTTSVGLGSSLVVTYGRSSSSSSDWIWIIPSSSVSNNLTLF